TGRSGAGKSTVLKLIALLERPTRGSVLVHGRNTNALKSRHVAAFRRRIGVVFQDHRLLPDRPVFDNVALPLAVAATPLKEIDQRVMVLEQGQVQGGAPPDTLPSLVATR